MASAPDRQSSGAGAVRSSPTASSLVVAGDDGVPLRCCSRRYFLTSPTSPISSSRTPRRAAGARHVRRHRHRRHRSLGRLDHGARHGGARHRRQRRACRGRSCILIGPLVGLACGLVNGLGLTLLQLPHPFIMTLGTLNIARGLTNLDLRRRADLGPASRGALSRRRPIPISVFGAAGRPSGEPLRRRSSAASALWFFLSAPSIGRHIYAIGGNPQAARVSGINVDRMLVLSTRSAASSPGSPGCCWPGAPIPASPMPASAPSSTPSPRSSSAAPASSAAAARCSACFAGVLIIGLAAQRPQSQ